MSTQVARIGGQLLQDNLLRELADLKFDNDLLVIKRDNTLGINTTTTPRNLTINGTLRTTSGGSDPDVIFGNSFKVGDITLATTGISTASGNISIKSTHPQGFITTAGVGSYNFAVKGDGIQALQTNGGIGIKSEVFDGQTAAWNSNGNYGNYWDPGPKISASSPPNDMDRLYDYALTLSQSGNWTAEELAALDWDGDGDIQADDVLQLKELNTQFVSGTAFPASNTLAEHSNTEAFKAYIAKYYPRSVPKEVQLQTGGTLTVTGNVHATGNITYGGTSITIGDDSTDSASFLAEFKNDLIPDDNDRFHIGKDDDSTGPAKGFRIAVENLVADSVKASGLVYQGIELTKDVGIYFVSTNNGADTNDGNNPGGPFASLTKALSVATDGDLIYIYPGQYQEAFPMTVPKGVTIQGDSIRGVEIYPTSATQSNDAFLLNSDVTIENITLKDYYYNSGANTGYGFRFANNFTTNIVGQDIGRSPYIRNCTVITKGTTTSASDPRGFASGDAGKGALVDGQVVSSTSRSASILFHAVTFITPGVDALTMTNGVRVEWLNSFTYFANRGIYMTQGSAGRTTPESTTVYGGELRTIASANVYGNKGIEADGANCLAYMINQNFAYIGSGKNVTNDNTTTIQANEVTELNNAKVHFTGQDQRGNFRVGDKFLVDLENERTSFDIESIFATNSQVQIRNGNNTVTLNESIVALDNIAIQGNVIEATKSAINFNSVGNIVFQGNVNAPSVETTGNLSIGGALTTIGDAPTDTVDFNTNISQDFTPGNDNGVLTVPGNIQDPSFAIDKTYTLTANGVTYTYGPTTNEDRNFYTGLNNLGIPGFAMGVVPGALPVPVQITYTAQSAGDTLTLANTNGWTHVGLQAGASYRAGAVDLGTSTTRWKELHTKSAIIDSITISSQSIATTPTNADLKITATGTGRVRFENLEFEDNKIIGKFSPEGVFTISDYELSTPAIFNGYTAFKTQLPKYTTVFGIPVLGTATVSDDAIKHAANMLASYLDNDFDGVADDSLLLATFSSGLYGIVVYADATEESTLSSIFGAFAVNRTFGVYQNEMNSYQGDGVGGQRDLASEKILKNMLIPRIIGLYTDISTTRPSILTTAMDSARGGYQAGGVAGYNYPAFAWYTDATGLNYNNLCYEYLYLLTATMTGALVWRAPGITSLFDHYTSLLLANNDAAGYALVNTASYKLPITNTPSIDYWTSVTNVLGGTSRDVILKPSGNVTVSATSDIQLPVGTTAQRPPLQAGLRYNSTFGTIEGLEVAGSVSLGGIYDTDRDTYLDLSNNQYQFVTAGQTNHTLNGTLLESQGFSSDHKFSIDGNIVSSDESDGTSVLRSNGTGYTEIESLKFRDSELWNWSSSNFIINLTNTTGNAYLKIDNTSGMVVPQGTTAERPGSPEVGTTRYNKQLEYLETWNGTNWINAAGEVESIESSDVEQLAYVFNLILD
ncbi:MAG: hypothetical protein CMD92_09925 [Gammaproteobacteria bacterium]|nr:hypothetical protein [Gammaproteobacteria bacterium]